MPRGYPNPKLDIAPPPKQHGKVRRFFSNKVHPLPFLDILAPSPSPRPVASERVLAALQPDAEVVVAAKTFVKEKMGDDKYDVVEKDKARVTRTATARESGITKAIPNRATSAVKPVGRVSKLHKVSSAKTVPKRMALGLGLRGTVASRLKTSARGRDKEEPVTRKSTLRSNTVPSATDSTSIHTPNIASQVSSVATPPASGSSSHAAPAATVTPAPVAKPALHLDAAPHMSGITVGAQMLNVGPQVAKDTNPARSKEYMNAGLYCQDENPAPEAVLVERVLRYKGFRKRGRPRKSLQQLPPIPTPADTEPSFPPLPLDHGYRMFFETETEFRLPYNIMWERDTGALDGKKRPPPFGKLRSNQFVERSKRVAERAVCKCDASSDCGDNCMNRHMNFICGRQCPAGEGCTNRSLTRRPQKAYKIAWTGTRGFGMFAAEDIAEGEFVMDYRGEVIDIEEFCNRIDNEYKGTRNFYALHYDGDEVVDAGMRGNDARFINHGCSPNLEVRKLQTVGDGFEEYEIGFWAIRDIKAGEELLYDYNFEAFTVGDLANEDVRVRCQCGASNCIGFMGRRSGEKSAKELARDLGRQTEMRGQKRKAPPTTEGARAVFTKRRPGKARQPVLTPAAAAGSGTSGTLDASGNLILPVKRKVGRPRIHPLPDPNAPRRKPGRPRIHPLPDPSAPKRKPGRPRKHPLPAPVNDVPATDSGDPAPPVASETPAAALDAATPSETPVPDARASPAGATARAPLPVATPPSATLQPPPKAPKTFWVANSREQAPATAATPAPGPAPRAPRAVAIPATSAAAAAAVAPTPSPPPVTAPTSAPVPALVSAPPPTLSPVSPVTVKKEDNESDWEDATTVGSHRISATNKRRAPSKSGPPGKKRGPGRPRKIPPPTPPPPPPPGAKRGPGRPRKIRNPEDELPVLGPRITPKQAEKIKRRPRRRRRQLLRRARLRRLRLRARGGRSVWRLCVRPRLEFCDARAQGHGA